MKNQTNNNIKEYESEEGQKMKTSDELEEHIDYSYYGPNMKIVYSLISLIIVILIGLGIFIYFQIIQQYNYEYVDERLKPRREAQPIQAESNIQPGQGIQLNKPLQPVTLNLSGEIVYKEFEMKHYIPDTLDLKFYTKYLPRNENNETYMNLNDIFNSKYLYINNSKITFNYIYLIRQKDFQNDQERKTSFKDMEFKYYVGTKAENKTSLRDFYELCEDQNLTQTLDKNYFINPLISIVISVYKVSQNLLRTIKSIQNQTFKNLEIIIVDDKKHNLTENCKSLIDQDFRIRVIIQKKFYSLWRKRMDGFLYSRGKYILHMDAGHILADDYVLEDIYDLADKYDLDTVRFSFSRTLYNTNFIQNKTFGTMKIYPYMNTKIVYGRPNYDVHRYGYGTIWNRLVRADMFSKGLDLVDGKILNIKKNLWEDLWWNDLIDRVSFSNLIVNRLGYVYLYSRNTSFEYIFYNTKKKDKSIREFIYFWYFDLVLLPKNDNKKNIINILRKYNDKNNTFYSIPLSLAFLKKKSKLLEYMINKLISDSYVAFNDKMFLKELLKSTKNRLKKIKMKKKRKMKRMKLQSLLNNTLYNNSYLKNNFTFNPNQINNLNNSFINQNEYINNFLNNNMNIRNNSTNNIGNLNNINITNQSNKMNNTSQNNNNNYNNNQPNQINNQVNPENNNQNNINSKNPDNQLNYNENNQINNDFNKTNNYNENNQININNNNHQEMNNNNNINKIQQNEENNQIQEIEQNVNKENNNQGNNDINKENVNENNNNQNNQGVNNINNENENKNINNQNNQNNPIKQQIDNLNNNQQNINNQLNQLNNNEINRNTQNNTFVNNNLNNGENINNQNNTNPMNLNNNMNNYQHDNNNINKIDENQINNQFNNNINQNQQLNNRPDEGGNNINQNEEREQNLINNVDNNKDRENNNNNDMNNWNNNNINNINDNNDKDIINNNNINNPNNENNADNQHNNNDKEENQNNKMVNDIINKEQNQNNDAQNSPNNNVNDRNPNLNNNVNNNINNNIDVNNNKENDINRNRNINFNNIDKNNDEVDNDNNHQNNINGKNAEDNDEHDGVDN